MRNKRETDISRYTEKPVDAEVKSRKRESSVKRFFVDSENSF